MGIDCYLYTEKEYRYSQFQNAMCACDEQTYDGVAPTKEYGYIRESYGNSYYITRELFPECFVDIYNDLIDVVAEPYIICETLCNAPPSVLWERLRIVIKHNPNSSKFSKERIEDTQKFLHTYEELYDENKHPVVYISY